jgi:hypothetical protein
MSDISDLMKCNAFVDCQQANQNATRVRGEPLARPTVTLSRETGAGALTVANKLAA